MSELIITVGLPGSGKTTYLKEYFTDHRYFSADDVRQELFGNASVQGNPAEIWEIVHQRALAAINERADVVIDGTFVRRRDRQMLLAMFTSGEHTPNRVRCLLFSTPLEQCLAWNASRERVVPEQVIRRMAEQLKKEPPGGTEGFNLIELVNPGSHR